MTDAKEIVRRIERGQERDAIFHPVRARQLSGDHIGRTVTARMVYPFSGPVVFTGTLYAIEHRTDGTQLTITDDHGPHAVMLGPDDTIRMESL